MGTSSEHDGGGQTGPSSCRTAGGVEHGHPVHSDEDWLMLIADTASRNSWNESGPSGGKAPVERGAGGGTLSIVVAPCSIPGRMFGTS